MKHLQFWFDPVSPYACLAFEQLPQALEGLSYSVDYRPVLFAGLLKQWGQKGPAEIEPKRAWTFRHVAWQARRLGIPIETPAQHPFNPLALSRLLLACADAGRTPNRRACELVLRHVWRGGADANDAARLEALRSELAPVRDPLGEAVKQELKRATDEALARGIFGVPTIEVDGRLFWGLDALPMLADYLRGDPWFDGPDWQRAAAPRPGVARGDATPGAAPAVGADPHLGLMTTPVRALLKRAPVTLAPTASILETARTMREHRVSSVLLIEREHLFGLVTDRDLRNRALAAGLDTALPVLEIATVAPLTVGIAQPAFEALLLMARHNIHHVPVLDGQRVAGMITATDLTEQHSTSAVYLAGEIHKQGSVEGLAAAAQRVKDLQRNLAAADASAYSTGHIVSAITDAITTRLLQLGEAALGPPPVDYAWVAAGSQARSEQTARSDQDNCMILDDRYDEAAHGAYFKALAGFVNDGLNACGYVYCPGEMMARTDEWRQPRRRWREYFHRWTDEPEPKALMLTCVFFDLRLIYGRAALLDELRREVLRSTRDNRIFLAYMVGNALDHRPPLTLFGGIHTVRHGELRDAVDLKHSGIVPIVDLARIYALAGGHEAVNTHDRLMVAAQSKEISERSAHDLRDALEFMGRLRIRHQAAQIAAGRPADNFLSLAELSDFERSQLKNAFGVVQTLQSVLAQRYR